MEAAHKASLARGEVGIREREPVPALVDFAAEQFLPFVRSTSAEKPNTIRYENSVAILKAIFEAFIASARPRHLRDHRGVRGPQPKG
jgi:hypothetical protein